MLISSSSSSKAFAAKKLLNVVAGNFFSAI
jgi:hypothetical protein